MTIPLSLTILPIPRPRTSRKHGRFPHQPIRLDPPPRNPLGLLLRPRLLLRLQHRLRQHNDVLALAVPQHIQVLQRVQHVRRRHGAQGAHLLDRNLPAGGGGFAVLAVVLFVFDEYVGDGFGPVGAVAEEAEVREGFLGGAELGLALGELVAKGDEELAEPFALVLRQGQDAGEVVALGRLLFLAEVPDEVAAVGVADGHAVEEERVDVVVERLVVEEELAQQAEVAAPAALPAPVDFEEGYGRVAVDFVAGGVQEGAFGAVPGEGLQGGEVAEAELADVHRVRGGEGGGVRRKVPRLHFEGAHLNAVEVPHARYLGLVLGHAAACPELFDFFFARVRSVVLWVRRFGGSGSVLNVDEVELGILAFGSTGDDFGGDHGDGVVTARAVLLASHEGRPYGFGRIARGGAEFWGLGVLAACRYCGRRSRPFLARGGFGESGRFGSRSGRLLRLFGGSFGLRPLDFLGKIEARCWHPLCRLSVKFDRRRFMNLPSRRLLKSS